MGWMPEYLAVICCACAGARLNNTAAMAEAMMRMESLPGAELCVVVAQRYVGTNMFVNEPEAAIPALSHARRLVRGLLFYAAHKLCRVDETQRDQEPDQGGRHV